MENIAERTVGYREFKAALDSELQKAAEGFVKIGFLLRLAMETQILEESGYRDVYEFADREYNLDKSQVSRFININIKFSEDGHSDRLQDQYRGYGYAKLAVMLQLPGSILEELSPEFSKAEIQTIHEEIKEEKKTTDIEIWLEGEEPQQAEMDNDLSRVLHQFCHENPEIYRALYEKYAADPEGTSRERKFQEILAPAGEAIHSVRIKGIGRLMLSVKGIDQPIAVINVRTNEKNQFGWEELMQSFALLCAGGNWREGWETIYKESLPPDKKEEVAPVQQQKPEERKPTPRKVPKVTPAKKTEQPQKEPEAKTEAEITTLEDPVAEEEPRQQEPPKDTEPEGRTEDNHEEDKKLGEPVQSSVEDFPEILPEGYKPSKPDPEKEKREEVKNKARKKMEILLREFERPEPDRDPEYMLATVDLLREYLEELRDILEEMKDDQEL